MRRKLGPADLPDNLSDLLEVAVNDAIDDLRTGDFHWAANKIGIDMPLEVHEKANEKLNRDEMTGGHYPWDQYLAAAEVLREHGY